MTVCMTGYWSTCGAVQDFREPLYLRDAPLHIPDTRSQEERKYPEFFRHKLKGAAGTATYFHYLLCCVPQPCIFTPEPKCCLCTPQRRAGRYRIR